MHPYRKFDFLSEWKVFVSNLKYWFLLVAEGNFKVSRNHISAVPYYHYLILAFSNFFICLKENKQFYPNS